MKTSQRWLIAIPAVLFCVAATEWVVREIHAATGNAGYLGTELAGVEGIAGQSDMSGVIGTGGSSGAGVVGGGYKGVMGDSNSTDPGAAGVTGTGVNMGVHGAATSTTNSSAKGVQGVGPIGVFGLSDSGYAVNGQTTDGTGVYGVLTSGGSGHAGYFQGRVHVNGTLSKSAGSFKIDHPLDPAGKYLSHSFVESPDMKNFYDGVVTLDARGRAVVELPEWFDALNTDFRYQLTTIGEHAPVYIAEKIRNNRFRIAGGYAGMEVSWLVTGTRNDPYAKANRIAVEELKGPREAGRFLNPELYGQPGTQRVQ